MPEIKNTFLKARMNKDLDERLIPKGEYRDAMNIQVTTSEGSDVGTVQNILGNSLVSGNLVPSDCKCIGAIADEKNDKLYWFVKREFNANHTNFEAILEYSIEHGIIPVLVDTKVGTPEAVLKFPNKIITGINIINNLLLWTDGVNEPRRIDIQRCINGTPIDALVNGSHTQLSFEKGSFHGTTITSVFNRPADAPAGGDTHPITGELITGDEFTLKGQVGRYGKFHLKDIEKTFNISFANPQGLFSPNNYSRNAIQYRNGEEIYRGEFAIFHGQHNTTGWKMGPTMRRAVNGPNYDEIAVGDVFFGDNVTEDITEEHIIAIRKKPSKKLDVKINTTSNKSDDPIFEKIFPRFSYRYKYIDNQYSAIAPYTDVIFNPQNEKNSLGFIYNAQEATNTSMVNKIKSIELSNFILPDTLSDVVQVDILYKQENSNVVYVIANIKYTDDEFHAAGTFQGDIPLARRKWSEQSSNANTDGPPITNHLGDGHKGRYIVDSENIRAALPENQTLRPWDNLPRKALSQEITSNRVVYGNYTQGYNPETSIPNLIATYKNRGSYLLPHSNFEDGGLPSIKSQRNYQVGVVFGDKYGRETPVFTSSKSAVRVPWKSFSGVISANQTNQIEAKLEKDPPSFAEYIKYFVKETSGEYYNLIMEKAYLPHDMTLNEMQHTLWLSFPSAERNKIKEDDYIILKKKIGSGQTQVLDKNRFKVIDIQNEAPDFVKFEYFSMGSASDVTDPGVLGDLFTNADARPTRGNTIIEIDKDEWLGNKCNGAVIAGGGSDEWSGDKDYLKGEMYMSWSRIIDNNTAYSSKYKIIDANVVGELVRLKIEKPISREDHFISTGTTGASTSLITDYAFQIEQRREKNNENFSGKFFVKVFSDPILKSSILDSNTNILSDYVISVRRPCFYAADKVYAGSDMNQGLVNSSNTSVPVGGTDSPELLHGHQLTDRPSYWSQVKSEIGSSNFFIDAMYMQAGQICGDNYAKNSGQIWQGIHVEYPENPIWDGRRTSLIAKAGEGFSSVVVAAANRLGSQWGYKFGWKFPKHASGQWYNDNTNDSSYAVNGLEGVITSDLNHTDKPYKDLFYNDQGGYGDGMGIRRWKKEYAPGMGMYKAHLNHDNTYGEEKETGKFFIHLSILAPGEDLVDSTSGMGDSISPGNNSIANGLQGIWGGGVFTKDDGVLFGSNDDQIVVPMEGKTDYEDGIGDTVEMAFNGEAVKFDESTNEAPGPGIKNSFGYDERYKERHENQWNPTWKKSSENAKEIQSFIDNLKIGKQFKFEADSNEEIYTIKKVSIKKLYNHTGWKKQLYWGGSLPWLYDQGSDSVEKAVMDWADTVDSDGNHVPDSSAGGNDDKLAHAKDTIKNFGRANNRRLCYIIEVDKNPKSSTYNPVNGTNIDLDTSSAIQFIEQATSFIEVNSEQPIIWETEPKESIDLDIYHEASDVIPIKLNDNTCEIFAPVGCRVENLNYNYTGSVITRWISKNEFEIKPGWQFKDDNDDEIDYSNTKVRFYRKDGSYTTALLSAQPSDPSNTLGAGTLISGVPLTSTDTLRTRFYIDSNIGRDLEVGLSWYNCFSFGNGIESNRIRDGFNEMTISKGPIVSSTLESNYQEETRTNGLIYSGIYNADVSVNELNQFIMAEKITKDLNPTYGSIQKLFQRRVGLVAFCEDRIVDIVAGKDTLFNADGNPQLIASNKVLGTATPFVGDYGISKNPESFASESYRAYFTDKQRGAVLRLSMDGLTPISNIGMRDWFRDNLKIPNELVGTYDEYKKEYNITFTNNFTQNLLRNSFITAGEELINLTPTTSNIIENGNFASGIQKNKTEIRLNGVNSSSYNNIPEVTLRHLDSQTTVINHPAIPFEQYQAAQTGQSFIADSVNTFSNTFHTILDHSFTVGNGGAPGYDGTTTAIDYSTSGPFHNDAAVDFFGDGYVWARTVDGGSPATHNDGDDYHKVINSGNNYWGSGVAPGLNNEYFIGSVQDTQGGYASQSTVYTGLVFPTAGGSALGSAYGVPNSGNSTNKSKSVTFPWTHTSGTMPNNNVPQNVLDWNATHPAWNIVYNPPPPFSNTLNFTNGDQIGAYDSANNLTAFYGEEFKVTLNIEPGENHCIPRVYIMDGNIPVDSDIIFQHSSGPFGNNNTGTGGFDDYSLAKTNITGHSWSYVTGSGAYAQTERDFGYVSGNQVTWNGPNSQIPQIPFAAVNRSAGESSTPLTFYIKFRKTAGALANAAGMEQGIAVQDLKFKLRGIAIGGFVRSFRLESVKVEKIYTMTDVMYTGQPAIPTLLSIPPATVPAWTEVSHDFTSSSWNISLQSGDQFATRHIEAINQFGQENPAASTTSMTDDNGTVHTWDDPNPNGVIVPGDQADGVINNGSDKIEIDSRTNTGSAYITHTADIPLLRTADKWVMIDVVVIDPVLHNPPLHTGILVRGLIEPAVNASGSGYFDTQDFYNSNIPYGAFGSINMPTNNGTSPGDDRGFILLSPTDHSNWNELHGYNLIPIESNGYYASGAAPANSVLYRAVVKIHPDSYNVQNNDGRLRLQFYNFSGKIDIINVRDISERETGGSVDSFSMDYNSGQNVVWSTSTPTTTWKLPDYGGGDDAMTPHAFSQRRLFLEGDKVRFVNATAPGQILFQTFSSSIQPAVDGYEFRVRVDNHSGDILKIQIRSDLYFESGSSGIDSGYKLTMYINEDGIYKTDFNFDGTINSITKNEQPYTPSIAWLNEIHQDAQANMKNTIGFRNDNLYTGSAPSTPPILMTCDLSDIRLIDRSNFITGGSVDYWEFIGFDLQAAQYIFFENNQIKLNDAPDFTEIRQVINKRIKPSSYYRIRFNYSLTSGRIRIYYFTSEGSSNKGFRTDVISFDDTNPTGVYDKIHRVGENGTEINDSGALNWESENGTTGTAIDHFGGELLNTFVVQILEGPVEGEVDNFFMQKALYTTESYLDTDANSPTYLQTVSQMVPYDEKTISFNEENKGWVSFKSFIPENGISVSNKYFTILDGKLYEHYTASLNNGYNTFYNEFTPSHVTTIFNDEPSIVKTFHTLNYEGSLSRRYYENSEEVIDGATHIITNDWEDGTSIGVNGWYADIIRNNSGSKSHFKENEGQAAQILEFKSKEGKWFNNITGVVSATAGVYATVPQASFPYMINLEDFSVQGLGVVLSTQFNFTSGGGSGSSSSSGGGSGSGGSGSGSSSSPY